MMFTLTDIPQTSTNIFDCLSVKTEFVAPVKTTEIIDYMVTVYPREERINNFQFVYGVFEPNNNIAFSENQHLILNTAKEMFVGSYPLDQFEQDVLNKTFNRLVKSTPTLPGRK